MDSNKIAQRLRELRQYKPRRVVAEDIGISESALTAYEMGARVPRDEIKIKLADYYDTTVEAIFFAD
jgi:DNA-binding XRE family transcriptional regulator